MKYKAIIIGGSAGSFQVVTHLLSSLGKTYPLPIILVLHRLKHVRHGFVEALSLKSNLPVTEPFDKESIKPGKVYLAPANYHLYIDLSYNFSLSTEEQVMHSRPSIDLTFSSAAFSYKEKAIGIILSGANRDGAMGFKRMKNSGALTIVQDPTTAQVQTMPLAAIQTAQPDFILKPEGIAEFLNDLVKKQ